jgi:hypothetical protein
MQTGSIIQLQGGRRPVVTQSSEPLQVGRHRQQSAHDLAPVLGQRHGVVRREQARDGAWSGGY